MTHAAHARARSEEPREHGPEPWARLGRYIRDSNGRIVVRGKSPVDARRVVACINALMGVPTETIENWNIQVVGGAGAGPDPALSEIPADAAEALKEIIGSEDRRLGERRKGNRRRAAAATSIEGEVHERQSHD